MKISYQNLVDNIQDKPSIDDISSRLFQLGHENEILDGEILDIEFTPNRGDCLSLIGLLRDLSVFYKIQKHNFDIYDNNIDDLALDFKNKAIDSCPNISFLKLEIENEVEAYDGVLCNFFKIFNLNKNNFFTDISNYIMYETGQPTHCYDSDKINNQISLEKIDGDYEFKTLFGEKIALKKENLVFLQNNEIINLAGVMGGESTACTNSTRSVIIECAYFNPSDIIGKTVNYDIKSDAAYKFERGVDPSNQEWVLRRFIKIVEEHATIKNIQFVTPSKKFNPNIKIPFNHEIINKKIGISISSSEFEAYLNRLGFICKNDNIHVPSYRSDISNQNDIAEEIARVIGFDNIPKKKLDISKTLNALTEYKVEDYLRNVLIENGFYEVINNPFDNETTEESIKIDNPLVTNKNFLRTSLKNSLINNLLYNERRQKDSIKFFEISDIYTCEKQISQKRVMGIICSGRVGKNYKEFSKKIDKIYLESVLKKVLPNNQFFYSDIERNALDTKIKNKIIYVEIDLENINEKDIKAVEKSQTSLFNSVKYKPISEYPSSSRDLSFSIKDPDACHQLQTYINSYKNELLKEVFIFDFFVNTKSNEIKIGYRFIFQSMHSTITDDKVRKVMNEIIQHTTKINSVSIPGLH